MIVVQLVVSGFDLKGHTFNTCLFSLKGAGVRWPHKKWIFRIPINLLNITLIMRSFHSFCVGKQTTYLFPFIHTKDSVAIVAIFSNAM